MKQLVKESNLQHHKSLSGKNLQDDMSQLDFSFIPKTAKHTKLMPSLELNNISHNSINKDNIKSKFGGETVLVTASETNYQKRPLSGYF
jgi:hypothetical protein